MSDSFCLKSSNDDTVLTFAGAIPRRDTAWDVETTYRVTVESTPVRATLVVHEIQPHRWSEFFADLASNWSGWNGARECESASSQIRLACSSDRRGHISARVCLRNDWPGDWRVEKTFELEAGQLEGIARRAREYFG
jgi:hypothetical protein